MAGLAGLAVFANLYPLPDRDEETTGWRRIAWPFPRDAFPAGRAWKRGDTEVFVRPKLGFCGNCDTGVVEDSEVDRVSDIDLRETPVEYREKAGRRAREFSKFCRALDIRARRAHHRSVRR